MTPRERVSALAESARNGTHWASHEPAETVAEAVSVPDAYVPPQHYSTVAVRPVNAVVPVRQLIDGDQVLTYICTFLKRFAVWGSDAEIICTALWIAHTHARTAKALPIWQYCARLAIIGESGSGKSWKTRLIGKLSYSGEILVVPTKPAFIDLCAENHTLILTEADEQFRSPGKARDLIAVANASYEPDRTAPRKQGGQVVKVPLFCHLVLDGIDEILNSPNRPDLKPLMSRCLKIFALPAPPDPLTGRAYRPPRFDSDARAIAEQLSQRASAWMSQEVAAGMEKDVPPIPDHLGNRAFALWEPLYTVAMRADECARRRLLDAGSEAWDDVSHGPWVRACAAACEQLQDGQGLPQETRDQETELDRQMAAWDEEGSR